MDWALVVMTALSGISVAGVLVRGVLVRATVHTALRDLPVSVDAIDIQVVDRRGPSVSIKAQIRTPRDGSPSVPETDSGGA
jgi:hypothetical protein